MQGKVLVVDDESEIADLIEVYLKNENFEVLKCYSSKDALSYVDETEIDLAILDIMLPEVSGLTICQMIREKYTFPIIMLTAKDSETDKITGLTLGADDYITKPFRPLELVARVKAQLRRYKKYNATNNRNQEDDVLSISGLVLNIRTHECMLDEKPLPLTPTEFAILKMLMERKGDIVSSEQLFHSIWKDEYYSKNNNTITVHIRHLREKLGDSAEKPKYIRTVYGVGYKIESKA